MKKAQPLQGPTDVKIAVTCPECFQQLWARRNRKNGHLLFMFCQSCDYKKNLVRPPMNGPLAPRTADPCDPEHPQRQED